jgi:hypothetical protein
VASVSAGNEYSAAVRLDGAIWTWGWNGSFQLGVPRDADRLVPVRSQARFLQNPPSTNVLPSVLSITASQNGTYLISLNAQYITSFAGKTITVSYSQSALQFLDAAAQIQGANVSAGPIPGTGITIASVSPGIIKITFSKSIPSGKAWSGVVTVMKFKALASGATQISVS